MRHLHPSLLNQAMLSLFLASHDDVMLTFTGSIVGTDALFEAFSLVHGDLLESELFANGSNLSRMCNQTIVCRHSQ
jgi:hypothetical protein